MEGFAVEVSPLEEDISIFEGLSEEQKEALISAYMVMDGYAWHLYEKENKWLISVKHLDALDIVLWCKIRVVQGEGHPTVEDLCIDFESTNFNETKKFELLYYTERNRSLLLDVFLGKYAEKDSEEYEDYEKWVIK